MSGAIASEGAAKPALTPPPGADQPVRHPDAPAPGELVGPHYDQCFGCGGAQPHGLHLQARAGEGVSVTAEFTVQAAHMGAPGLAHGGVLVSALDVTLGALYWLLRTIAVTGRLETDFLRPVPVDTTLYLTARCTGRAGRKIYGSAEGRIGESCEGDTAESRNRSCDSTTGANDGSCDACTVAFGVSTEDEMFVLLGSYVEQ